MFKDLCSILLLVSFPGRLFVRRKESLVHTVMLLASFPDRLFVRRKEVRVKMYTTGVKVAPSPFQPKVGCPTDHLYLSVQTALSRSPIREEPQHANTCGQPCQPDHTQQVASQGGAVTREHMRPTLPVREESQHMQPTLLTRPHSNVHTSSPLWMQSSSKAL